VFKRRKQAIHARRLAMIRPAADGVTPRCRLFGLCGGCSLQELSLEGQRRAKHAMVLRDVAPGDDVRVHTPRGAGEGYGYRNKVELSFGVSRYLSEADHAEGLPIDGRFLGFHAPGRFDRVVDAERCELLPEGANKALSVVRAHALTDDAPPPYDVRSHEGYWRHLVLRHAVADDSLLIVLVTAPGDHTVTRALADALMAADLGTTKLVGIAHAVRDAVSDVARGEIVQTWGTPELSERLGDIAFRISPWAFFQTSTRGAEVLYDTVGEAVGEGGTLLDLYAGTGTIGLYLAHRHDGVLGVELVPEAVADAVANAERHGIANARYLAAKVEDVLDEVEGAPSPRRVVVDPPRPGLHPSVARTLARLDADVLVYVACKPSSLGRDKEILAEGGWRMTDLWTVDLFPQTGHVEAVARFVKDP
jgi:23S rRNA (uracil1939-C5)-methyltransferase